MRLLSLLDPPLQDLIINISIKAQLFDTVSRCLEALTIIENSTLVHFIAPLSHTLLCVARLWLILEMASIQFCNDISFIIFKLSSQVLHSLLLVGTAISVLKIATKACRDEQAGYLLILRWVHRDCFEDLLCHCVLEIGHVVD